MQKKIFLTPGKLGAEGIRYVDHSLLLLYFYKLAYIALINYSLMLTFERAGLRRDVNLRSLLIFVMR